ncbi:MAG: ribose-5-phosphate isomerase A, partial [Candidatus Micrarchaeota archaeon]
MSDSEKEDAARKAQKYVKAGMAVGLGTGSTSSHFIKLLGERNRKKNLGLKCIATSIKSEQLARECGLDPVGFEQIDCIDVAVDGADVIFGKLL